MKRCITKSISNSPNNRHRSKEVSVATDDDDCSWCSHSYDSSAMIDTGSGVSSSFRPLSISSSCCGSDSSTSFIKFDKVMIREYRVTIGDNPSCSRGAPVCLNWQYDHEHEISLDAYESCRGSRRYGDEMKLPAHVRHTMLKNEWGISTSEIKNAQLECEEIQTQRMKSRRKVMRRRKVDEYMSSFFSSFTRLKKQSKSCC
mmetsp:Transcript_14193/g.17239  ORF Transcript_14193/g.17239 Transcript_14193/m.17239 type:complete len:201 (-) Transcript_14193:127-729(-)